MRRNSVLLCGVCALMVVLSIPVMAASPALPAAGMTEQLMPEPVPQRISFAPGATSAQVQGTLAASEMKRYVVSARGGQTMVVKVAPGTVQNPKAILIIWGVDGTVLMSDHVGATAWSGPLPSTQDYYIDVRSVVQSAVKFTLDVEIPPLPAPEATPVPQRISFAPGGTSTQVEGTLAPGEIAQYVIRALRGQTLIVKVTPGTEDNPDAVLVIWGADGTVLISDHAGATAWSGPLPSTQDYYIEVVSVVQDPVMFVLDVTVPPLAK